MTRDYSKYVECGSGNPNYVPPELRHIWIVEQIARMLFNGDKKGGRTDE